MVSQNLKIISVAIVAAAMTVASLSVAGLLQSTERLGSSGIIIESVQVVPGVPSAPPAPSPPPPEPQVEIDIYSDLGCTTSISTIDWGEIETGESSVAVIYVKNNGETDVLLSLDSDNWTPPICESYTSLSWNYDDSSISPGEVLEISLRLDIDNDCPAADNFSFDVVIIGS